MQDTRVTQNLLAPADARAAVPPSGGMASCSQIAELVAIRTFIKLKVFDAIPLEGAISLPALSEATGAQESLLGA